MSDFNHGIVFENPQEGRLIELTRDYWAIVDEDDYEELSKYNWYVSISRKCIYANRRILNEDRKHRNFPFKHGRLAMHCEVMGTSLEYINGVEVDHINRNGLDNRKSNLRISDRTGGARNRGKYGYRNGKECTSKYKGVVVNSFGFFLSHIFDGVKIVNLGSYEREEDAALAFDRAARELHGEFACTNFPDDDGRVLVKRVRNKLTHDQAIEIKRRALAGENGPMLAKEFGISNSSVNAIKHGRIRKGV
jgi:hypothetical protein